MLADLIELIARIWRTDSALRDRSLLGESEHDKQSRRIVGKICGGAILLLLLAALLWWWFTARR